MAPTAGLIEVKRIPLGALKQEAVLLRHEATGLRILHCNLPGPLCQMDVVVPTECTDNMGLPHCLEHLVFMGSAQHPTRGFLDKLANLCLAQGTNAWTDKDHTAYNAVTAGHVGLLRLMPVFLDHVMHPTLTENQFITEIYHLDGEGKQNGVVFCEMQGREATEDDMADLALHRLVYPGTGYMYECGGLTPDIATLNNKLVQDYHARFYRTDNAFMLVHGQVPLAELENVIDKWHKSRKATHTPGSSVLHPFSSVPAPLRESVSESVEFPAEDESIGSVSLAWSGPHIGDVYTCVALEVLFRYLQEGPASPIAQHFVECLDPISSGVEFDLMLRLRTCIALSFSGVPNHASTGDGEENMEEEGGGDGTDAEMGGTDEEDEEEEDSDACSSGSGSGSGSGSTVGDKRKGDPPLGLGVIKGQLIVVLQKLKADGLPTAEEIREVIKRHRVKLLEECEEEPADALHTYLLPEILFHDQIEAYRADKPLNEHKECSRLNPDAILSDLEKKDSKFWADLLDEWIISAPCTEVVMVPSSRLAKERAAYEASALEDRKMSLGVSGLSLAKDTLDKAVLECSPKPLPPTFKVPDIPPPSSICRLPMKQQLVTLPTSQIPVQVVRLNTHFYHVSLCLDASSIPSHLRPYINLLREMLLSTNLEKEDGTVMDYKHVVKMIQKETVSAGCGMGLSGGSPCGSMQGMFLFAGVSLPSREGYTKLCEWIHKLLFKTKFDEARVTTCIKNALQDITGMLRDGSTICSTLTNTLTASELIPDIPNGIVTDSCDGAGAYGMLRAARELNDVALSLFRQKPFMKKLIGEMRKRGKDAAQEVVSQLEELRSALVAHSPPLMIQIGVPADELNGDQAESAESLSRELSDRLQHGREQMIRDSSPSAEDKGGPRVSKRRRGGSRSAGEDQLRSVPRDARVLKGVKRYHVAERCVVVPVEGIDSSYVQQVVPCCVHKFDPDFMPVYFLTELLSRSEGPLWVSIRGAGYAYHASLDFSVLTGQLMFTLVECGAPSNALVAFRDIIKSVPDMLASADIDKVLAETRASILYSLHSRRSTATGVMHCSMKAYFTGAQSPESDLDQDTERVCAVGTEDLMRVWKTYFSNFLQQGFRCTSVACPGKLGVQIRDKLEETLGVAPEIRTLDELLIND